MLSQPKSYQKHALEGKTSKDDTINMVKTVELNVENINGLRTDQDELREEIRLQQAEKDRQEKEGLKEGMNNVQEQIKATKEELLNGIHILEKSSLLATTDTQTKITNLKEQLVTLQQEHVVLNEQLGMATEADPKAINVDNLNDALASLENKMEAIRDTKLGNEELELKMKPLVDQFENLTGSLSNLQSANNKVKESTLINQQKLANEAKKTLKLTESMNQLKTLSESMSSGGGAGIDSDLLAEEMKQTQDLLMEEISTPLRKVSVQWCSITYNLLN